MATAPSVEGDLAGIIARIRLVVFDFDGVFTDNTVYVFEDGREAVRCWRSDGLGIRLLESVGIESLILSTECNPVVSRRARKLGMQCVQGCEDKAATLLAMAEQRAVRLDEVAYVGNDINDAQCLSRVGLPIVVQDAHANVKHLAIFTTTARGGRGAVREVCDVLHAARSARSDEAKA